METQHAKRRPTHSPRLAIAPGETWCRTCGSNYAVVNNGRSELIADDVLRCGFCGSTDLVPAEQILRRTEYRLAA